MHGFRYPNTQSELLRAARGPLTQTEFARELRVDRSCLCRYEGEKLGAPPRVINYCLKKIAAMAITELPKAEIERALHYTRSAVRSIEREIRSRGQ